jgi:dTDP-glucose 4,6-dehydratase
MNLLVTGGSGFIGSNLIRLILRERPGDRVVNLDNLSYAGSGRNLDDLAGEPRYRFVHGDICDLALVRRVLAEEKPDAILHLAAESHVDRSILESALFLRTNVEGTRVLLDSAREAGIARFIHVSTDEVYGDLGPDDPPFTEETPIAPSSPYSASKAGADLLARAFFKTYGLPVVITRCSNNYGPYQFPEKLIPLMITNAIEGKDLPVYGDGRNVRDWIAVEDHARGLLAALDRGRPGEVYNFGGNAERENVEVIREILRLLDRDRSLMKFVKDRPGHDRRYAMNAGKARRELGWEPRVRFEDGLARTVAWYRENRPWWERLKQGSFQQYYEKQYGARGCRPSP